MTHPKDHSDDVVVPDEAKRAARLKWAETATWPATIAERWGFVLAAAAPFIVAANQPEPAHEVACPACGATIRARMADQPNDDLRELLAKADFLDAMGSTTNPAALWAEFDDADRAYHVDRTIHFAAAVESFVAAQVAAAQPAPEVIMAGQNMARAVIGLVPNGVTAEWARAFLAAYPVGGPDA